MIVNMAANVGRDKSVTCEISVDGRQATVLFAEGEITLSVPSDDGEVTFAVPEALVSQEPGA